MVDRCHRVARVMDYFPMPKNFNTLQPYKLQSKPTKKPQLNGLALVFQNPRPGQSHNEAVIMAWLGSAHGLRPGQAQH